MRSRASCDRSIRDRCCGSRTMGAVSQEHFGGVQVLPPTDMTSKPSMPSCIAPPRNPPLDSRRSMTPVTVCRAHPYPGWTSDGVRSVRHLRETMLLRLGLVSRVADKLTGNVQVEDLFLLQGSIHQLPAVLVHYQHFPLHEGSYRQPPVAEGEGVCLTSWPPASRIVFNMTRKRVPW